MADASENAGGEYLDPRALMKELESQKPWYDIDIKSKCSLKNAYITVSIVSFLLLGGFGCVYLSSYHACLVPEPTGRCCPCWEGIESPDNLMPRKWSLIGVYYGLVMVLNTMFGISYVVIGVTSENQYQMLIMLVTQFLECGRGVIDVILDEPHDEEERQQRAVGSAFVAASAMLLLLSVAVVTPVYRSFGWASFKRAGAKRSTLQMYKTYQRFRALNRLDVQSSFLLFFIFLVYVGQTANQGAWVFIVLFVCDTLASRFMVKYLKQEDLIGIYISMAAKVFVVCWWSVVVYLYFECFGNYDESRARTAGWFSSPIRPRLTSMAEAMNGVGCLAPYTVHDSRTYELVLINLTQAVVFRFTSVLVGIMVIRNFGKGLKEAMYALDEDQAAIGRGTAQADPDESDAGSPRKAKQFVPRAYVKAEEMETVGDEYRPMVDK